MNSRRSNIKSQIQVSLLLGVLDIVLLDRFAKAKTSSSSPTKHCSSKYITINCYDIVFVDRIPEITLAQRNSQH